MITFKILKTKRFSTHTVEEVTHTEGSTQYTFDKMWISGGMIKSLLKIILGRPSCVKEQ